MSHPIRMDPEEQSNDSPEKFNKEARGNKIGISEGADLYGDISTAEGYGYVSRGYDAIRDQVRPIADGDLPA